MKKVFYFFIAFMIAASVSIAQATPRDSSTMGRESVNQTPMGFDDHTHGNYLGLLGLLGLYGFHKNRKNSNANVEKRTV